MTVFGGIKTETKLLVFAACCGILASALAYFMISGKEKSVLMSMDPVRVLAASKYIPAWTKLDETMVEYIDIPKKFVTKAHIKKFEKHRGLLTVAPFVAGEPVLANKLSEKSGELNAAIPTGLRAVSVAVDEESGVGYMIKPGDYVDVIVTYQNTSTGTGLKNMVAATVLQDVRVVAVGQDFSFTQKNNSYGSVTLALTPEEAEVLVFAREKGKISFTLRALGDRVKEKIKVAEFEQFMKQIKKNEYGSGPAAGQPGTEAIKEADAAMKKRGEQE